MWGECMGDNELENADFLESPRMNKLMARPDVVLANNKAFGEKRDSCAPPHSSLNCLSGLTVIFYSQRRGPAEILKEGALVIPLEPFVAGVGVR